MPRPILLCMALFCAVPLSLMAKDASLEEQVAAVKADIAVAQQTNSELKAQLAARETEAAELKTKLKQIDEQITAFRKEHKLELK